MTARASAASLPPRSSRVDERLVDLQDVEREALQVAERRVAGAEIVDRQPHAQRLERLQRGRARRRCRCISTLSVNSSSSAPRREPRVGQRAGARRSTSVGRSQLPRRDVDAHVEPVRCARRQVALDRRQHCAACRHASSSTQRPIGTISPVSSASGMKSSGAIRAAHRVLPAHQRLDARHAAAGHLDDGLVLQAELAPLDGAVQVRLHHQLVERAPRRGPVSTARGAPCRVRLASYIATSASPQQRVRRPGRARRARCRRWHARTTSLPPSATGRRAASMMRSATTTASPLRRHAVHQHRELVAAEPRHRVAAARRA